MKPRTLILTILSVSAAAIPVAAGEGAKERKPPTIYVPYRDVASLIGPLDRAVLMQRESFEKLLAAAKAAGLDDSREVAQITRARYQAEVKGEELTLTGTLAIASMSDKPVAVPLRFGRMGLSRIELDGRDAPLGYDRSGRLVLIVTGRGKHTLAVSGSAVLKELSGGGMQFSISLPTPTAGEMSFSAPGDLEVHATVPVSARRYDKQADRTEVGLTLGGHGSVTVVLMGNGRQEDQRAILLGTSAITAQLTRAYQTMHCMYTVQVLRRGVRELTFALPAAWTITDVSCPALVKWSVIAPTKPGEPKRLLVRLRTASRGTKALHIQATAPRGAPAWSSPFVTLENADFEHGHLLVDTGGELKVRGQTLTRARREDMSLANAVPGLLAAAQGRLFYYWSDGWSVRLDLATVALRRSCEARHRLTVAPEQLALNCRFDVTAVGRELFDLAFELPAGADHWRLSGVTVDGKTTGFEYRVVTEGAKRTLKIALARPVRAEGVAKVGIAMRHVPGDWKWPTGAAPREVSLPVVRAVADTVSGQVAVAPAGDLDLAAVAAPKELKAVTVGRMSALGLAGDVQLAYTYEAAVEGDVKVRVSRRTHRLAAEAIGLVTARPTKLIGVWRIVYSISRAQARTLYLLADKSLGRRITITAPGRRLSGKNIVQPGPATVSLLPKAAEAYDLWQLTLDSQTAGLVTVNVQYDRPLSGQEVRVPLIRPIGSEQINEMLAVQASEELAIAFKPERPEGTSDVDAVDLPALPAAATRLLRAFRLESPTTVAGAAAEIGLAAKVYDKYTIPPALAADATFTTYLGARGSQRTQAIFRVANAGMQFLAIRLPKGAQLWSVKVAGAQAKPKQEAPDSYLVAMPRSAEPVEVQVVFALPDATGDLGRVALGRATLGGVNVNKLKWTVIPPPGYRVAGQYTDMETDAIYRPRLAGQRLLDGLKELFAVSEAVLAVGSLRMMQTAGKGLDYAEGLAPSAAKDADETEEVPEAEDFAAVDKLSSMAHALKPTPAPPKKPPAQPDVPRKGKPTELYAGYTYYRARGRYTLPVELVATPHAGPAADFTSLGDAELEISLADMTTMDTSDWLGLAAVLLVGLLLVPQSIGRRAGFVATVLGVSTLVAIWWPTAAHLANGAFFGAVWLIPVYVVIGCVRWLWRRIFGGTPAPKPAVATAAAVLIAALLLAASTAEAGGRVVKGKSPAKPAAKPTAPPSALPPVIVPYEDDPTRLPEDGKVLVPYRRYVELWNRAHPEQRIDLPRGPVDVSLAGVRYAATLVGERMNITLTARVKTFGKGWVVLAVPMKNLAVTAATLDGKDANLQVGPKGMVLTLPGETAGELKITAVTTPKQLGRRGSLTLSLPPLPGAIMTVDLPADDLELEAPGVDGAVSRGAVPGGKGVRWTVPLGMQRDVTLKWSPKVGVGAADRTLSAAIAHDVYAFHWAMVGVSKVRYSFSAGENERFGLLLPAGATLTDLTGANIRDSRDAGERTIEGMQFKLIEVRLHRPATKAYELTARWVGKLPALDKPARLALPRAADVGRESGTVTLHAAGGITLKVTDVAGARRSANGTVGRRTGRTAAVKVATYYWPYRPFSLTVQLARHVVTPTARVDQLVRVDRHQVQLLVQASLSTKRGRIFGASFALPDGYELLSAIGPVVEDHYEQPTPTGRRLHVNFRTGVAATNVALVLVRKDVKPDELAVPAVTMLDADGNVLSDQTGRLAVQVAASLEAETAASENLRPIAPRAVRGWLDSREAKSVQFAYSYEKPTFSLRLKVRPQKTNVRVEVFGGLTVQATSAWYSYRLRYRIEGTPIDRVDFTLPSKYDSLVAVGSPALRSVTKRGGEGNQAGRTVWTVALINEVTGILDVTVNFATPISAATSSLVLPRIITDVPGAHLEGYRAILAVQNASRHELGLLESKRLVALPPGEQAKLLSEPIRRNLQFVLQSFTDDWSAILTVTPAKAAARIQAVVDLMALTTVIDRSGRCRYEALLALQNRTEQFLHVQVPGELRLWSATVASQPVKPVIDPNAGADVVLIPLVKTSPGGLPYDVKMYFAGRAAGRLGLLAKVAPPAIRVRKIKVIRTTWSLRLPKGYRYMQPGGNLSPVVAGVESKIIALRARMDQLKRLRRSYDDLVSFGSVKGKTLARKNWRGLNTLITSEIAEARQTIVSNAPQMSAKSNLRLRQDLDLVVGGQWAAIASWDKQERELRHADDNVNVWLNNDAFNGGVAEIVRNGYLNTVPNFVRSAAEGQKKEIAREMVSNEAVIRAGALEVGAGTKLAQPLADALGLGEQGILVTGGDADRRSEIAGVLVKLRQEQHRYQKQRQDELKGQLALFGDNRLDRYYGNLARQQEQAAQGQRRGGQAGAQDYGFSLNGGAVTLGTQAAGRIELNGRRVTTFTDGAFRSSGELRGRRPAGGEAAAADRSGAVATGTITTGRLVTTTNGIATIAGVPTPRGEPARPGDAAGFVTLGGPGLAVARGTFSLPVTLPAGGEQRDFHGPSGEPVVTILAVDERLIDGAYSTAAVIVIAAVVWLLSRLWLQLRRKDPPPAGCEFLAAYVVLAAVLAGLVLTGGVSVLSGIVLFGVILCPVELLHRLLARRAAPVAA